MSEPVLQGLRAAETDEERIAFWRFMVLVQAGYPRGLARQLVLGGADVHAATKLLADGCPPQLAVRILL